MITKFTIFAEKSGKVCEEAPEIMGFLFLGIALNVKRQAFLISVNFIKKYLSYYYESNIVKN